MELRLLFVFYFFSSFISKPFARTSVITDLQALIMKASSSLTNIAKRLQGKVALITGGASGIGESTARLFAKHGAKVIVADIQDDLGFSVCDEIKSGSGQPVSYIHCDVTSDSDVQAAVNTAVSMHGKLDIMFSNAGISGNCDLSISSIDHEDFKRVFDVNVYGGFLAAKHAARVMIPEKKGSILFSSSCTSVTCGGVPYAYKVSKVAVVGLTKNLCVELGQYGIRVNCISPAAIPTPMVVKALAGMDRKTIQEMVCSTGNLKEAMVDENDVAEAALYLGSDESKYISGMNLVIDGGYSLKSPGSGKILFFGPEHVGSTS